MNIISNTNAPLVKQRPGSMKSPPPPRHSARRLVGGTQCSTQGPLWEPGLHTGHGLRAVAPGRPDLSTPHSRPHSHGGNGNREPRTYAHAARRPGAWRMHRCIVHGLSRSPAGNWQTGRTATPEVPRAARRRLPAPAPRGLTTPPPHAVPRGSQFGGTGSTTAMSTSGEITRERLVTPSSQSTPAARLLAVGSRCFRACSFLLLVLPHALHYALDRQ
jgi:hypothetical protein